MDERQGRGEKTVRSRSLGGSVVQTYLWTAAALAITRVSVLAWVEYRTISDRMTATVYDLFWVLRPELLLGEYTRVGAIDFQSIRLHFLFWASLLMLGSFVIASPILLVGWLKAPASVEHLA